MANCPQAKSRIMDLRNTSLPVRWLAGLRHVICLVLVAPYFAPSGVLASPSASLDAQGYNRPVPAAARSMASSTGATVGARQSLVVLGQQIVFTNPAGYCTPGTSARELELMNISRRSLGNGARLIHAAVRCNELEEFRNGRRELLDHWLQIQLIGRNGNFQRIEVSREAFVSGVAREVPPVDTSEVNRRINAAFEGRDVSIGNAAFQLIGRDGNAAYFSIRALMTIEDIQRPVSGVSALTLLNALPLAVNVYEATGSPQSRQQLASVQQELLLSLFSEN